MTFSSINDPQAFQDAFSVSRETIAKLELYASLLLRWQKAVQLVAPSTLSQIWFRHFADSAQLLRFCPSSIGTWIDMGSGAGFPGLVVALLARDEMQSKHIDRFILIESDTRKAAFLREVTRQLGLIVDIYCDRIELSSTQGRVGHGDIISARACAPLVQLLEYILPYWKITSMGLFLKGAEVDKEITQAYQRFNFKLEIKPSLTDPRGQIIQILDLAVKGEG